jgi:flagellar L-ring protein FlgH
MMGCREGRRRRLVLIALVLFCLAPPLAAQSSPASWTTDRRELQVGHVISVLLNEYTMASANRHVTAEQERSRRLAAGATLDGATLGSAGAQTEQTARSRDRGQATRHDRLSGEMTVRVVEVGPGGLLRVEGKKVLRIDDHEQELTLSGWLRPEDVPAHNVIESWRIADASIEYASTGRLGRARGGIIGRLLGWLWP